MSALPAAGRAFALPEFYLPWPARVNPGLDAVRERGRIWARGVGMLDEGVWDEAKFDAVDLAGAAAYCFPDAPPQLLALLADWGAWAFYADDLFLERFKRSADADGARAYVESTARLVRSQGPDEDAPVPADAAQRALADLWARTAPLMSEHWRRRFAGRTVHQLREMIWELENINAARVPNPVEYLHRRRGTAAGAWIADLVELANAAELRPDLVDARPLRVLRDSFGDSFLLRNDLFSYQREIEQEGEVNNGVLVLERFLDLAPPAAAEAVNNLITSRMQQFEHTLGTEVPLLFEERALSPADRIVVLAYAKGLQDFQAGMQRWMEVSPRYSSSSDDLAPPALPGPRGLGTAAARLWETYRPVQIRPRHRTLAPIGPSRLATFRSHVNPHLESIRAEVADWAQRMGMLDGIVWSQEAYDRADVVGWVARTHPEAGRGRFARIAKWYVWRGYLDAVLDGWFAPRRDYLGAKAYLFRLRDFLPADGVSLPPPASVVERALADLWPSTFADLSPELRRAFPGHVTDFADGRLWELANRAQGRVPDSVDYLEMRRHTVGQGFATDLVQYALGIEPQGDAADVRGIETAFADVAAWLEDIRDYGADVEVGGTVNNGVLVLERLLGCTPQQAMNIAGDLVAARVRELEQPTAEDGRYVEALRAWLGGTVDSTHQEVAR